MSRWDSRTSRALMAVPTAPPSWTSVAERMGTTAPGQHVVGGVVGFDEGGDAPHGQDLVGPASSRVGPQLEGATCGLGGLEGPAGPVGVAGVALGQDDRVERLELVDEVRLGGLRLVVGNHDAEQLPIRAELPHPQRQAEGVTTGGEVDPVQCAALVVGRSPR